MTIPTYLRALGCSRWPPRSHSIIYIFSLNPMFFSRHANERQRESECVHTCISWHRVLWTPSETSSQTWPCSLPLLLPRYKPSLFPALVTEPASYLAALCALVFPIVYYPPSNLCGYHIVALPSSKPADGFLSHWETQRKPKSFHTRSSTRLPHQCLPTVHPLLSIQITLFFLEHAKHAADLGPLCFLSLSLGALSVPFSFTSFGSQLFWEIF